MAAATDKPLLFLTVGTDHHPFDRVIRWVDRWLEAGGRDHVRCIVQSGASVGSQQAESTPFLDNDAMEATMREAAVMVCHGGPGTIMLAAAGGLRPIVVPRTRQLGEHVDDHQVAFARRMAGEGVLELAETEERLHAALDASVRNGDGRSAATARRSSLEETVQRFEDLVDGLVHGRPDVAAPAVSSDDGDAPVRVLYIAGLGRSGSTLLDMMLGELPHLIPVGELRFVFKRGLRENELCGCGAPFRECEFWSAVGEEAFGGWDRLDAEAVELLQEQLDRHRFLPFLIWPRLWPAFARRLRRYADVLARLYRAIETVGGGGVVVDSTKDPPYAFLLRHVPNLDVRVVQLVRDSRGVAYSWTKRVEKPERTGGVELMNVYHPAQIGLRWTVYNLLSQIIGRLGVPRILVRYESLVASPTEHLGRIMQHVGERLRTEDVCFLTEDAAELGVHHTVAGNPMRFSRGRIQLRVDDAWRTELPPRHRTMVQLLTWPLMRWYGYPRREET